MINLVVLSRFYSQNMDMANGGKMIQGYQKKRLWNCLKKDDTL